MYLGIDGYRHGWVVVSINEDGNGRIEFLGEIVQLARRPYTMAMIDIPIGLPKSGTRRCDKSGRDMLGEHRARLFTGARRCLLSATTPEEANQLGIEIDGTGVSRQLFHILKKIGEVDEFVKSEGQQKLREAHPELVFLRLSRGRRLCSKRTFKGFTERLELLRPRIPNVDELLPARIGKGAKKDDVLDASACAIAAMDYAKGREHVTPYDPKPDCRGLMMQIWY
jgi:predicted RNase H-like nuclease